MFESIWKDVEYQFKSGNMLTRIIIVNIAIFVVVNIIHILLMIVEAQAPPESYYSFIKFFSLPSKGVYLITHPWTIITHMFLHEGFWHILWNMLMLYWFGRIVGDLLGDRKILPLYLLGGLTGGFIYFIVANFTSIWGTGNYALGASAAVMALVVAAATTSPDYIFHLLFLGPVRLKYIAVFLIFLDLIAISWNTNSGGSFAHLGGSFMGWFFVYQLRNGNDYSIPTNKFLDKVFNFFKNLFKNKPKRPKVIYKNPKRTQQKSKQQQKQKSYSGTHVSDMTEQAYQERLDGILDKIKESGYDSLSREEKDFLFDASKR